MHLGYAKWSLGYALNRGEQNRNVLLGYANASLGYASGNVKPKTKCPFRVCKTSLGYAVERTFLASTEWVNALKGVYNGTFWTLKGG